MASEIKTRTVRKDIKAIDKAATTAQHMKHVCIQIKEQAEQTQQQKECSPVEYAKGRIGGSTEQIVYNGMVQVRKQSGKALRHIRKRGMIEKEENQIQTELGERRFSRQEERLSFSSSGGENAYQPKEQLIQKSTGQGICPMEQRNRKIKTTRQVGQTVKSTGRGRVKAAGHSIKTVRQTAGPTVKTTEQAAKNAYKKARASRKTADKTTKAAVKTAANAVKAVIAGTKALITTIVAGGWIAILVLIIVLLFGAFLSVTGGDNSSTVSPISAEVQAYEPLIRKYAKQYGIGEYVELIKAVMMQESGGQGNDPMQSSEGSFNTKYPRIPDGITEPEYSIKCGVQELASCFASAEVKSPMDMDNIKLALQGYNYGNGYIEWAKTNYGGYTLANAAEFSDKLAKEKGWESYGDKQYVPHVLRYYSLGRIPNGVGNQTIVQVALAQEGNGGDIYWSWYGFSSRVSWCACFVSWCADQSGYLTSGVLSKFSLCSDGVKWFQDKGQFKDGSYVPAPGNIIFFDWGEDGTIDHVGIVESVSKGNVNTIEGNSGDAVKRHSYSIGDGRIYGYGVY